MRIQDDSATSDGFGVHTSLPLRAAGGEPEDGPAVDRPTAKRRSHRQPVESLDDRRGNRLVPAGEGQKETRARLERIQAPCVLEVSYSIGPTSCLQIDDRQLEVGVPVGRIPAERPAKGLTRPFAVAETPRKNPGNDVRLAAEDVEPAGMLEPVERGGGIVPPGADGRLDVPRREPGQRIGGRRHNEADGRDGQDRWSRALRTGRRHRPRPSSRQRSREPQHGEGRCGECRHLPEPVERSVREPVRECDEARRGQCRARWVDPATPKSSRHREGEEPDEETRSHEPRLRKEPQLNAVRIERLLSPVPLARVSDCEVVDPHSPDRLARELDGSDAP